MHDSHCTRKGCGVCRRRFACECLQITEAALIAAMSSGEMKTINDIRRHTGAGDACTACHKLLKSYLEGPVMATA